MQRDGVTPDELQAFVGSRGWEPPNRPYLTYSDGLIEWMLGTVWDDVLAGIRDSV